MSIQIYGYNPYFYPIARITVTPAFLGGGATLNNTPATNFPSGSDALEFSAENKIKSSKKDIIGITAVLAAVYGCIVGRKMLHRPTFDVVHKNLSEILGQNLSKEETRKLLNNYKNIIKNNKTDEYHNKLFEQVKKDMGYEDLDIELAIEKLKDSSLKSFKEHCKNGSAGALHHKITIYPKTAGNSLNSSIQRTTFGTMFHEWQHIKQAEIAYRTNPDKLVDAYVEQLKTKNSDFIEQLMKENKYSRVQALKEINSSLHKQLDTLFGKYPKFKAGSDQYQKGLKYIECTRNYTTEGKEYFEQLSEKEAFEIGDKARKIYDYISNPWRIF